MSIRIGIVNVAVHAVGNLQPLFTLSLTARQFHTYTRASEQHKGGSLAIYIILRSAFGYLFLVLMVRIAGRRPGKQLTPFEFVLIFYLGGLTLTGMVGEELSLTNAITQIITIGLCHYALAWIRFKSDRAARLLDGIPVTLLEAKTWRTEALSGMRIQDDDVMDMAREQGISSLETIESATLETFGEISILPSPDKNGNQ